MRIWFLGSIALAVFLAGCTDTIFQDNFETDVTGGPPSVNPSGDPPDDSLTLEGSTAAFEVIDSVPLSSRSLKIDRTTQGPATRLECITGQGPHDAGSYRIEFDAYVIADESGLGITVSSSTGEVAFRMGIRDGQMGMTSGNGPVTLSNQVVANTVIQLQIDIHLDAANFDVSMNGARVAEDQTFVEDFADLSQISFEYTQAILEGLPGVVVVDNIKITKQKGGALAGFFPPQQTLRLCLEDLFLIHPWPFDRPIVPGCEVIDCCPGCPGPGPLEWEFVLNENPLIDNVTLEFSGVPGVAANAWPLEGNGRWDAGQTLVLQPGRTHLRGIPGDASGVMAHPRIEFDEAEVKKALARDRADDDFGRASFAVRQKLGPFVVREYRTVVYLRACDPPQPSPQDFVKLTNNTAGDDAVVYVDGRRSLACVADELQRVQSREPVPNLLAATSCNSELVIFSDDNAMELVPTGSVWTDAAGDEASVGLNPMIQVPVTVWLTTPNVQAIAQADIANANLLFNTNHAGIAFNANYQNVSNNQNAANLVNAANRCSANWTANLTGSNFFTAGQINVYYTNQAMTGFNCIATRNIIVIGTNANNQTLAHEIGHAYSLAHVTAATFGNANVMVGGGAGRTTFTEGQCFRMNINTNSMLNANGDRTGVTRTCAAAGSPTCLPLGLDANPN